MFVLDVPENEGMIRIAEQDSLLQVSKTGPYYLVSMPDDAVDEHTDVAAGQTSTAGQIVIDRRATGMRHAVWYSAIAGLAGVRVAQHDKDALRLVRRETSVHPVEILTTGQS